MVNVGIAFFHVTLGLGKWREAELSVERVSVGGDELEAAQALEARMSGDELKDGLGEAAAAVRLEHVNVAEVGERGEIGDDAGESDLMAFWRVDADAERVFERAGDDLARDARGPVAARQEGVDGVDVEERGIVGDEIAVVLERLWHEGKDKRGLGATTRTGANGG